MTKLTAAALAALMLLSLAACGQTEGGTDTTGKSEDTTVSEEELLYGDLPTGNFNGYEFNVLQYKETTAATATVLTEMTGTPIEDALYERMLAVEDRLGVKFVNNLNDLAETVTLLRNCITGGLDEYDVYWGHSTTTVANFLSQGYLTDMNEIDAFDFSKPWWDKTANENLALDEHLYMAFGDINIYLFDFHSALLFNKDVTDEYGEDLYGMVKNGEWTMEQFIRLATDTALPASDGSKKYDRMAYTGYAQATMFGFIHGADAELFVYDENGLPSLETVSESYLNVLTVYNELFKNANLCSTADSEMIPTFAAQKATFVSCGVGQLGGLRNEAFHYGLLPFPKRDTAQKEYISFVSNQIQPMVIPMSASNTERTGVILENLAAETYRTVRPEYFQVLLESKYVRDPESLDNMNTLFSSETRFELEHVYDWGGFENSVVSALTGKADRFTSTVERQGPSVNKKIQETLEYLNKKP
jgi:ABC-type glycerol-3-phosphate transport system substrate-binding protein